jgi:hypothetical protein
VIRWGSAEVKRLRTAGVEDKKGEVVPVLKHLAVNFMEAKLHKGLLLINLGTRWETVAASRFISPRRGSRNSLDTVAREGGGEAKQQK